MFKEFTVSVYDGKY